MREEEAEILIPRPAMYPAEPNATRGAPSNPPTK